MSCLGPNQMANLMNQTKSLGLLQALTGWIHINITLVIIVSFSHRGTCSSTLSSMDACTTQPSVSQQASDCSRVAAALSQAPWERDPACPEGHHGAAEKTGEEAREEGGRSSLFFRSCSAICLSKVHLVCSRKGQEGWSRASCRVGKLSNSLLFLVLLHPR